MDSFKRFKKCPKGPPGYFSGIVRGLFDQGRPRGAAGVLRHGRTFSDMPRLRGTASSLSLHVVCTPLVGLNHALNVIFTFAEFTFLLRLRHLLLAKRVNVLFTFVKKAISVLLCYFNVFITFAATFVLRLRITHFLRLRMVCASRCDMQ